MSVETRFVMGCLAGLLTICPEFAAADSFTVVPAGAESVEQSSNQQGPLAGAARSYQLLIMPSELTTIPVGSVLTSMQFRLDNPNGFGWPSAGSTASSFVVKLGTSSLTPSTMTTTFASNVSGSFTTVYNAALTFAANALPGSANSGSTPEAFGDPIIFTQPYIYDGNALLVEIRSSGFVGAAAIGADAVPSTSTVMRGLFSNASSSATTGTITSGTVVRFGFGSTSSVPLNPVGTTKLFLAEDFAGTAAGSGFSVPWDNSPRTMEWVTLGSEFDGVGLGSDFVGLSNRSSSLSAAPAAPTVYTAYDILLSRATAAPGSMSGTASLNRAPDTVAVRTGILAIPINVIAPRPALGVPAPFSYQIPFTNSYSYRGGNIDLYLSHGTRSPSNIISVECALETHPLFNSVFQSRFNTIQDAAFLSANSSFPTTRLSVDAQAMSPRLAAQQSNAVSPVSGFLGNGSFVQQWIIAANELSNIPPGSLLTSLSVRNFPGQPAWPASSSTTTDFEITISAAANSPAAMTTNFANNQQGTILLVRDGPLVLPVGSLPPIGEGLFGTPIHFQRGYVYPGGDLCITVRHAAFNQPGPLLDASNPVGSNRMISASSRTATTGTFPASDAGAAIRVGYTPSISVPGNRATIAGNGGAVVWNTPLVYQVLVDQDQLASVPVGSTINGIAFRIDDGAGAGFATWPPLGAGLDQFDVDVSTSPFTAAFMNTTFAANEGADKVTVHSGSLAIPALSMPVVGTDIGEHGFFANFTKPFVYAGGTLCLTMRCGTLTGSSFVAFDAQSGTTGSAARRFVGSTSAASGLSVPVPVLRLAFTPKRACPADLNGDGQVDDIDFVLFAGAYDILLTVLGDFNFDGQVDDADFVQFADAYDQLICG